MAGRHALQVQSVAAVLDPKQQYDNVFAQALTAADVSVQTFLEVALLSQYPEIHFFGEEKKRQAEWFLTLPGTRFPFLGGTRNINYLRL